MQKRYSGSLLGTALLALAACGPSVPNSASQGVGFDDYTSYQAARAGRDAELAGGSIVPGPVISGETTGSAPIRTAAVSANNPGISDEQDFEAVSGRETIESDAERLARQRAAYKVIQPEALPDYSGEIPNIVEYALATTNAVGQQVYPRSGGNAARTQRNCASYGSPGLAQEAFLAAGGPERDRRGLDPDGDGFACSWDPTPFRAAR